MFVKSKYKKPKLKAAINTINDIRQNSRIATFTEAILEPTKRTLKLADHACHTTSKIYSATEKIKKVVADWKPWQGAATLRDEIKEKVEERSDWLLFDIHYATHACDPEFHDDKAMFDNERLKSGHEQVIKQWVPDSKSARAAIREWDDYMEYVFGELELEQAQIMHPKRWWLYYGKKRPHLRAVMIKAFSCGRAAPCFMCNPRINRVFFGYWLYRSCLPVMLPATPIRLPCYLDHVCLSCCISCRSICSPA